MANSTKKHNLRDGFKYEDEFANEIMRKKTNSSKRLIQTMCIYGEFKGVLEQAQGVNYA